MQKELHHSNNSPDLQDKINESKTIEWNTLKDEKHAIQVIPAHEAATIRKHKADRIMSSRFVITEKHEDNDTRVKSRWCLRGHHDPDLVQKVLAGKYHSPTLSQLGRNLALQLIVSHRWTMGLGDIKGAFLEANVLDQALQNPVYAELPPGGVPGVAPGSLVQVLGNIYGANDAPANWYKSSTKSLCRQVLFVQSLTAVCTGVLDRMENFKGYWALMWMTPSLEGVEKPTTKQLPC